MAFVFRLERVLGVRRLQEEAAQHCHAEALRACTEAAEAVRRLDADLGVALEELDDLKRRDRLTVDALYLHTLHTAGLRRRLFAARQEQRRAEERAEQTAAELLEAHRAVEALEKLKERDEAAWRRAQARREAEAIDEIAVLRHRAREEDNHGP